jgi:hypothetical protein
MTKRHTFSNLNIYKMYHATQQKYLIARTGASIICSCPAPAGHSPPKPPPLVELQRNPSGLRFFLSVASNSWISYYCCATANSVIRNSYTFQLSRPKMIRSLAECRVPCVPFRAGATNSMASAARPPAPSCYTRSSNCHGLPACLGRELDHRQGSRCNVCNKFARAALVARQAGVFFKRPS